MPKNVPWLNPEDLARMGENLKAQAEVTKAALRERAEETLREEERNKPKGGRKAKYPWDKWMDGDWHTVKRGVDFLQPLESFRSMLYGHAARKDMQVMTQIVSRQHGTLEFCFIDEPPGT
jgi:hypothetical protein